MAPRQEQARLTTAPLNRTTAEGNRGYGGFSALALAVEAVEALHVSSPTVTLA
jgi:hypothetical protein